MPPRTERQHFVPAFYLAQWATPQEREGRLRVFDRTNGRNRPSTPDAEGFARDFYLIESREAPQAVEDVLGKLEGIGAAVIREVTTTDALPTTSVGLCIAQGVFQLLHVPLRLAERGVIGDRRGVCGRHQAAHATRSRSIRTDPHRSTSRNRSTFHGSRRSAPIFIAR